jgi:peroxiredoxin Q/BCP
VLSIGSRAPDFAGVDQFGRAIRLGDLIGTRRLVLYFYPRDFTRVCTTQACLFRDTQAEIQALGANVAGVSSDAQPAHQRFHAEYALTFPLIDDSKHEIARAYDVDRRLFGFAKRVTYVISATGAIEGVFHHELSAQKHLDDVLRLLRKK